MIDTYKEEYDVVKHLEYIGFEMHTYSSCSCDDCSQKWYGSLHIATNANVNQINYMKNYILSSIGIDGNVIICDDGIAINVSFVSEIKEIPATIIDNEIWDILFQYI